MALTLSDIKVYKAANNSDTTANGGAITTNEVVDVVGALFPNVDNAERVSGSTKWRKMFFKITSNNNTALIAARAYEDADTQGADIILMAKGTATDTQASLTGSTPLYAAVALKTSVIAGATSVDVLIPTVTSNWFVTGQTVRITDKMATDLTGNEEFHVISAVAINGNQITLTFSDALTNGFTATTTRVMNVIDIGDVVASATSLVKTSTAGTFDISKITCANGSTVDASWTLTFTTSSAFNLTSSLLASPVSGNIGVALAPANPATSNPYFSIDPTAFGGTFTSGDVVSFQTVAATVPIWLKRIIPAGASPVAVNKAYFVLDGGSV